MLMVAKKFYVSGGNFHELQAVFSQIKGVIATRTGYINATIPDPTYEEVLTGKVIAVMGLEIVYNPKKIDISTLIEILVTVTSPYSKDKHGQCQGSMYASGVYYIDAEDEPIVDLNMNFIANRRLESNIKNSPLIVNESNGSMLNRRKCYAKAMRLRNFYVAEAIHQDYLQKHPKTETFIDFRRLQELEVIESLLDSN